MATSIIRKTPRSTQTVRSKQRLLMELRVRGARGGLIQPHRSMVGARLTAWRLVEMFALPVVLSLATVAALRPITVVWRWMLERFSPPLGLPGGTGRHLVTLSRYFTLEFPITGADAPLPSAWQWAVVGLLCAVALLVSLLLSARWLPLVYGLRFAVLIQSSALFVFALPGDPFPYRLPNYALGFLQMGAVTLVLVPLVLGLVFFPFDIALWRKLGLTALVVAHGAVLLPLQTLLHIYFAHHLSLLVLPTMFFVFGILVEIFAFVAFYGWGMSWPARSAERWRYGIRGLLRSPRSAGAEKSGTLGGPDPSPVGAAP